MKINLTKVYGTSYNTRSFDRMIQARHKKFLFSASPAMLRAIAEFGKPKRLKK